MMIRELIVSLSFLSMPAAVAVILGGAAAPFLSVGGEGGGASVSTGKSRDARLAYDLHCAACHGGTGEGTETGPALHGPHSIAGQLDDRGLAEYVRSQHPRWESRGGLRPARGVIDAAALSRAIHEVRRLRHVDG